MNPLVKRSGSLRKTDWNTVVRCCFRSNLTLYLLHWKCGFNHHIHINCYFDFMSDYCSLLAEDLMRMKIGWVPLLVQGTLCNITDSDRLAADNSLDPYNQSSHLKSKHKHIIFKLESEGWKKDKDGGWADKWVGDEKI